MKKKIFLLLLGIMLLGIGVNVVNAEEKKLTWTELTVNEKKYKRVYYNEANIKQESNGTIPLVFINNGNSNKVAFCLEMIEALIKYDTNGDNEKEGFINSETGNANELATYSFDKLVSNNSTEAKEKITYNNKEYNVEEFIELVAYYGSELYEENKNNNNEKNKYYLAAQRLIWQILADAKIYPGNKYYNDNKVKGKIQIIENGTNNELNLSAYENKIIENVNNHYNKPEILNKKEIKEYNNNDKNQKYFELDNKDVFLNNFNFSEKSECKLNNEKNKIICTDTNNDNKINIEIGKNLEGNKNNYYKISGSNMTGIENNYNILTNKNQMILFANTTPTIKYTNTIKIIPQEVKEPEENVITEEAPVEEEPVESPPTSDTNIILIITICLCALTSAIIIYIKKINLIKNNTI